MGYVFSLGVFGMLFGAFFGGRIADYLGQKRVLMLSVAIFGGVLCTYSDRTKY